MTTPHDAHSDSRSNVFGLPASCPVCGGELKLVNSTSNGVLSVGIFHCQPCNRQYEASIRLSVHRQYPRKVA